MIFWEDESMMRMKKMVLRGVLGGLLLVLAGPAMAQGATGDDTAGTAPVDESARTIGVPPLGVPVEPHRGFYTDFGIGTYFAFGGSGVSDGQPFLGLGLGYDLSERITLGLRLGMGSVAGACLADFCDQKVYPSGQVNGAESFSLTTADLVFGYNHPLTQQWFVGGKILGGMAVIGPIPAPDPGIVPDRLVIGFGGGLLATTELHTYLNHFVIGVDLGLNYRNGGGADVLGIEIAARFKYVF